MHVRAKVKASKKWREATLDGFEAIAQDQFLENLEFTDLYRICEGKLSYQTLGEAIPMLSNVQDVLDDSGIPSFLRHYDIISTILKGLTGVLIDLTDKYHVTDIGDIGKSDFIRSQGKQLSKMLEQVLENTVQLGLAEAGFDKDMSQFKSEEEKQVYIQELEQAKEALTPKDTLIESKKSFKTVGTSWGEATLDQDKEKFDFTYLDKENFKDYFISGRCFRHFRLGFDEYDTENWSAKNTFFSKEVDSRLVHKGEYVGRLNFITPSQVIRRYGHKIDARMQQDLLGGNLNWKDFVGEVGGELSGNINKALKSNFNEQATVPFTGYFDYNFYLNMQEETGIPLGVQTLFNDDGTTTTKDKFLPKLAGHNQSSTYEGYAKILRDDFKHRTDLCRVTEVFFRVYEWHGYLTYRDEFGALVTEEVDEGILKAYLKENNIKQTFKETLEEIVEEFEEDTLKWTLRPVIFEGVKIQSQFLDKPLYLTCEAMEHQIKGDSDFDRFLPVAGYIGESHAKKIEPYQAKHNLCMNQVYSLLEKELGVFFLMDVAMIPSEFEDWGDAREALMAVRNIAKDTGIMPVATAQDGQGPQSTFNQFTSYNLSNSTQLKDRIEIANVAKVGAYEVIGINQSMLQQPTKYETATGVKQNQEASWAQLSELFENFNLYVKATRELHLSVAQYAQSNKKDLSLYYTKSDGQIEFLKFQDPDFPLRRLGLIATMDSAKRKELETYKSLIFNNNTLGSDTIELAKLVASDGMKEAVEIATMAQQKRQAREDDIRRQELAGNKEAIQLKAEAEEKAFIRIEESKDKDRVNKLQVAEISSLGRASDKKSDALGIQNIKSAADEAIAGDKLAADREIAVGKLSMEDKKMDAERKNRMADLKLRTQELQEKAAKRKSEEYIATINKN